MTKNEFILKAMLQMAANTEYVETKFDKDENGNRVAYPSLLEEIIFIDAVALANEAEKRLDNPFDEEPEGESYTIGEHLQNITDKLGDIEEEMEREYDNEHYIK